jgi:hypothetical protein
MLRQPCDGYRAGLDAMLLAAIPGSDPGPATIVDLGAGVGRWVSRRRCGCRRCRSFCRARPVLVRMCAEYRHNDLGRRARAVNADIDEPGTARRCRRRRLFDALPIAVPGQGDGRTPPDRPKAGAQAMPAGGIERWSGHVLGWRVLGTATLIHRAEALPSCWRHLADGSAAWWLPVHPRRGGRRRVIVAGRKGSRAPMRLLPGLVVHNDDGHAFTPMLDAILQHGAGLDLWSAQAPALVGAAGIN